MCPPRIVLCFAFLLVASFSKSQEDLTNGSEQSDNSTVQSEPLVNSMKYRNEEIELTQYNSHKNSIKNEMQYESSINSTKNNRKNDSVRYESREHITKNHEENNQTSMESCTNSIETNNFTLQEINKNLTKTEDNHLFISFKVYENINRISAATIVEYKACSDNITCIQLCCPFGHNLTVKGKCIYHEQDNYVLPNIYQFGNESENEMDKLFFTVRDPCVLSGFRRHRLLNAYSYLFLANGSLYQNTSKLILPTSYCFAILHRNIYDVMICTNQIEVIELPEYLCVCILVSLPFLLLTFIVYSILPELQNTHGYILRAHVASLFISYAIMYFDQQISRILLTETDYCIPLAYTFNFFFLSSFFWLNITCFDIWWTFRKPCSHRTRAKHDKKKLVIYSIYAWGITIILNVIYAIMDNVSGLPENFVRPEICRQNFWFSENEKKKLYFYIPVGATIISNFFFFIYTTLTILYQKIHTAHQLRVSESKRHDENKQRFNMYLKLFIVMGISWIFPIISWLIDTDIMYPADMINALQGLIIFIIFVCRKKIKQMLLKRFDGQNCGPFKAVYTFCKRTPNVDIRTFVFVVVYLLFFSLFLPNTRIRVDSMFVAHSN